MIKWTAADNEKTAAFPQSKASKSLECHNQTTLFQNGS